MLERFPLKLDAELVFVEDLKQRMNWADKLAAAAAWVLPVGAIGAAGWGLPRCGRTTWRP